MIEHHGNKTARFQIGENRFVILILACGRAHVGAKAIIQAARRESEHDLISVKVSFLPLKRQIK